MGDQMASTPVDMGHVTWHCRSSSCSPAVYQWGCRCAAELAPCVLQDKPSCTGSSAVAAAFISRQAANEASGGSDFCEDLYIMSADGLLMRWAGARSA